MRFSTIAAVSTPRGKGGVAVLRVSGPDALSIGESVFRPMGKKKLSEYPPRTQIYGEILSSDGSSVLDDGLVTYFVGPHSFTGEDVVEFACHGGEVITAMILSALLEAGASPAEPGEYSRRAFLNGKLSLTAAEGVADLLDAKTESAALLSSKTARGRLSHAIDAISRDLLEITSSLWAYLDYPEEDLETMSDVEMISSLEKILSSCDRLLKSYQTGRAVNSGISAAIIGKPNVGKSSFFNALLGEERAIVTDLPGTTRDLIEYPVTVGRVLLNLQDSAGIRSETADRVEKIGIEKALLAAEQAEMIFCLLDLSRPLEEEDERILALAKEKSSSCYVLPVLTKKDLPRCWNPSDLGLEDWVEISVKENWEPDELVSRLESRFISDEAALREGQILTNARQKSALVRAREEIFRAAEEIQGGMKDVASLTLESALSALKEMDGQNVGEMILDQVFSRFCIGK